MVLDDAEPPGRRHSVEGLREVARGRPEDARALLHLGLACLQCGETGEAIVALHGAIAADPRFAEAHLRLGVALEMAGAFDAALAAFRRASGIKPGLGEAWFREGALLDSLGRGEASVTAFRRAAAAAPRSTQGRIAAAKALLASGRDAEAEKILRQGLVLDRGNAAVLDMLGNLLAEAGRFDEAREMLLLAVARDPLLAGSAYEIVRCRRIEPEDADLVESMRTALGQPGLEASQRARVHLALGKAADDRGDYAGAMAQFDAAEALRNTLVRFDPAAFEARVDRIIACFTPDLFAAAAGLGDASPILIAGLPRSGTTLVEQILSCHPDVRAGGELPFWNARGATWEQAGSPGPDATFLATAADEYLRVLRAIGPARVTDKMPMNVLWAGLIHLALPGATIVLCRRDPADTALSIHQTHFNPRMAFPTGGKALVATIRVHERLYEHWRRALPAGRLVEVEYEALTAFPEQEIRRLVSACGLSWHEACLAPHLNTRVVKTPSKWQARQPIHAGAAGRARLYEPWLGELRALLSSK